MTGHWRPARRNRRFQHDSLTAVDLFSGFGGLTQGIERAGFDVITAANHNAFKVEVHEANHPTTEHWIADLVDTESPSYHSVRDLPPAKLLAAGVSCKNHTPANSKRAYEHGLSLFDLEDPEYDAQVTRSERDRATANCVLHYAAMHHPWVILVECTTQLLSWGPLIPGSRKIGDGSTHRWWFNEILKLGYNGKVLFLNSQFFGPGQSRNRGYWIFWDKRLPTPDLEHRPESWCGHCQEIVPAVWTWKTGIPPNGTVNYGKQYNYRCPRCHAEVIPPFTPSLDAIDLSNLGTRIGDRERPLVPASMARAQRCLQRFAEFPAIMMPDPADAAAQPQLVQPQTAAMPEEGTLLAAGVDNFQGVARGLDEALPTQGGSETMGLLSARMVSAGVVPYRKHTIPTMAGEPMPTITSEQIPALLTAAGTIKNNGSLAEAKYRSHPVSDPLGTITSDPQQALLFSGWIKQNGSTGSETAAHPLTDPLGTLTSRDTTALLSAQWREHLAGLSLEDCYYRMMTAIEIGRGCGFDVDWAGREGTFQVWGSASDQVDGYGNAVTPQVGWWIGGRLLAIIHGVDDGMDMAA